MSLPGLNCSASSNVRMLFMSVAARLLPPFLPSIMILGISVRALAACLLSSTCTNPTGAPTIPAGLQICFLTSEQSSSSAVGALPKAYVYPYVSGGQHAGYDFMMAHTTGEDSSCGYDFHDLWCEAKSVAVGESYNITFIHVFTTYNGVICLCPVSIVLHRRMSECCL